VARKTTGHAPHTVGYCVRLAVVLAGYLSYRMDLSRIPFGLAAGFGHARWVWDRVVVHHRPQPQATELVTTDE
jgi:hypothetical protein